MSVLRSWNCQFWRFSVRHCLVEFTDCQCQTRADPRLDCEFAEGVGRVYRDGTTHIVMSPLEFMQRLAALVPRPRLHLIRFHGVLAPHARLRAAIVPGATENTSEHAAKHAHGAPARPLALFRAA